MTKEKILPPKPASLKEQIIDAASRVLIEEGYDNLSLRHVAKEVGCSQMAMYRHFANKDALIQYLCVGLYARFTDRMYRRMGAVDDPRDQIRIFISSLISFAVSYPDHYSLIFLVRQKNRSLTEERDRLGREFLYGVRRIVQNVLPQNTTKEVVDSRLRQILTCLHGTAALLISHPRAYGLNRDKAIRDTEEAIEHLLRIDDPR
jgi:AcrR family transcriptional regulator